MPPFQFGMPLTRMWKDDSGAMCFEGVASSTALDSQKERVSKAGLETMTAWRGIDLLPSHNASALQELGTVDEGQVQGDHFVVKGTLDPTSSDAVRLFERMQAGHQYGLSVGGKVTSAHYELEKSTGTRVRVIDGVVLDHIAVCRPGKASNPETWLAAIAKSAEGDWPEEAAPAQAVQEDRTMIHDAIAKLTAQVDDLVKAGARHSAADVKGLHAAVDALRSVCGCSDCSAAIESAKAAAEEAVAKSDTSTSFTQNLREEQAEQQVYEIMDGLHWTLRETIEACIAAGGDVLGQVASALAEFSSVVLARLSLTVQPDVLAMEDNPAAPVAKSEEGEPMSDTPGAPGEGTVETSTEDTPTQEGETVEKTVTAAPDDELAKAQTDKIADLEKQLADGQEALEEAQAEIELLKAQPVAGGPVNTAALEGDARLGTETDAGPGAFEKAAKEARDLAGTDAGAQARKRASDELTKATAMLMS